MIHPLRPFIIANPKDFIDQTAEGLGYPLYRHLRGAISGHALNPPYYSKIVKFYSKKIPIF